MRISVPPPSFWLCSHVHRQRSAQHGGHRRTNKTVRAPCAARCDDANERGNFAIRARGEAGSAVLFYSMGSYNDYLMRQVLFPFLHYC